MNGWYRASDALSAKMMLGDSDIEATAVYLHLSRRHLQAVANPLEKISVRTPAPVALSRRLRSRSIESAAAEADSARRTASPPALPIEH
jgi:hypothetical protein